MSHSRSPFELLARRRGFALLLLLLLVLSSPALALAQGNVLTYGGSAVGSITAETPFVIYTFNGNPGDQVMAYVVAITPGMTPSLSLLGPNQRQLAVNDNDPYGSGDGEAARVAYRLMEAGRYSLMVATTSDAGGEFLLRLSGRPSASSTGLVPGTPTVINVLPGAPAVLYSFNTDPLRPSTLTLSTSSPNFAFLARLYDGNGQMIAGLAGESLRAVNLTVGPGDSLYQVSLLGLTPEMQGAIEVVLTVGESAQAAAPTPQATATTPSAQPADSGTCRASSNQNVNVNVRGGPGTNYGIIGSLSVGAFMNVTGRDSTGNWYVVNLGGRQGWVAGSVVRLEGNCQNLSVVPAPPPPTVGPTATPTATQPGPAPSAQISFTVNSGSSATINAGQCATVAWSVSNIREVYYQNQGVTGQGSRQECPTTTTTYTLRVVQNDGSTVERTVTINVTAAPVPISPTPTLTPTATTPPPPQLNPSGAPNYGSVSLASGFLPDPHQVGVTSGGGIDVAYLGGACRGWATSNPDFRLNWSGGGPRLRIYFLGNGDTTLVVRSPSGGFFCNDDGAGFPNPLLEFTNPADGSYDIWVASFNQGDFIGGTLHFTELSTNP